MQIPKIPSKSFKILLQALKKNPGKFQIESGKYKNPSNSLQKSFKKSLKNTNRRGKMLKSSQNPSKILGSFKLKVENGKIPEIPLKNASKMLKSFKNPLKNAGKFQIEGRKCLKILLKFPKVTN